MEISAQPQAPEQIEHQPLLSPHGNLPCPFCGSVQLALITLRDSPDNAPTAVAIECDTCHATGPVANAENQMRALWNERLAPAADQSS
ncbi:Lar family restriction alleviation protein [Flagellatimonas centrodinii]|uniref:Lar family restriction alleviation protein n=1 Tax=Flagellatimonas centrodinii TaxID=2806210 RepID=UPI001FED7AA3|nr:Lar family restriction alleviation protein [Flagellatimonas centrodinii]ULQ45928.1 Lar family restriction alleviation protein [Flagellatimonas centrodinii]